MIEEEHREICEADKAEAEFLRNARKLLEEEFPEHVRPLNKDPLPRAQPCHGIVQTHTLEFDPRTKTYYPVPKVPQHERGE